MRAMETQASVTIQLSIFGIFFGMKVGIFWNIFLHGPVDGKGTHFYASRRYLLLGASEPP